jgi:hypothetical protein
MVKSFSQDGFADFVDGLGYRLDTLNAQAEKISGASCYSLLADNFTEESIVCQL